MIGKRTSATKRIVFATIAAAVLVMRLAAAEEHAVRRGPIAILFERDSGKLLVLCEKSSTIVRLHPATGAIEAEMPVGESPFALALHPDKRRLYVSCRRGQEVLELDLRTLDTLRRFPLRGDPTGVAVSSDGRRLYAGVHSMDQVAVFSLDSGEETKRLAAGNGPQTLKRSPKGDRVYVTNLLPNPGPPDQPCINEITVIDDGSARVVERILLKNANVGRQIAFASDASLAVAAISRPKNLIPETQVARGWVVTNGFVLLSQGSDEMPVQLLVDLPNQAFADPYAIAITPDGSAFYMTAAGSDMVIAVDLLQTQEVANEARAGKIPRYADHLGLSRRYVTARIPVGANPVALALDPNGEFVYCANRLDDSISIIEAAANLLVRTLVLGTPPPPGKLLQGERFFHSAARTFQGQFSCTSCHPDRGIDALQYDLEPDGIGINILDNRNLRAVEGTAPFKWKGSNPDISTQCGSRTAKWIMRTGWLSATEVVSLAAYIRSIPAVRNPYLAPDGRLSPAQERGKQLFERTTTTDGTPIPERDQCHFCHSGPSFTNYQQFDVGTKAPTDTVSAFDSAHLIGIFESPPYLHDGRAATLEEIWTLYNPEEKHGISAYWNKQQLNDLVEYLKVIGSEKEAAR